MSDRFTVRCPACGSAYDGREGEDGLEGYDRSEGVWTTDCAACGAPNLEHDEIALDLLAERKAKWTAADLKCAREALGLSMVQLADWLPWKQSRISEAERGLRAIPPWVIERIRALEESRDALCDRMIAALEADSTSVLIVHADDAGYRETHPTDPAIPAAVQRVSAALAAAEWEAETGERPHIVAAEQG